MMDCRIVLNRLFNEALNVQGSFRTRRLSFLYPDMVYNFDGFRSGFGWVYELGQEIKRKS